jgi:hypothetical protein
VLNSAIACDADRRLGIIPTVNAVGERAGTSMRAALDISSKSLPYRSVDIVRPPVPLQSPSVDNCAT